MKRREWIFFELVFAIGLLAPFARAQKPRGPVPAPQPSQPISSIPSNTQPIQPDVDRVMVLMGRVSTNDGSALPNNTLVERVCDGKVRQQVYAAMRGDFSMQMGSQAGPLLDASGEIGTSGQSQYGVANSLSAMGISRYELEKCELRASATGFHPQSINLLDLTPSGGTVDVGAIVVGRATEIKGTTLDVTSYNAPTNARKAYEKGLEAGRHGNLAEAHKYFEKAVEIYPSYESAWFQLGAVLEQEKDKDSARAAYTRSAAINAKFLPPYLALASISFTEGNWTEVLRLTSHVMELDPLAHTLAAEYILDLDEWSPAAAYFYNAVANYQLNRIEEAERSALKAQRVDLLPRFPQLHALLAEIYATKKQYALAASEVHTFLELVPNAKNADEVRKLQVELEKLSRSESASAKPVQN